MVGFRVTKFQTKCALSQIWMEICEKYRIFVQTFYFFIQNKTNGVIGWQICQFWSKTQSTLDLGWHSKNFGGRCVRSEMKEGVLKTLHSIPSNMGVLPPGSNYIIILIVLKDLWVILIFATPAGGHKCIKEHLECSCKSGNQQHPRKSSKFLYLFVYTFKATSSKVFDWLKRFFYTSCSR